MFGYNHALGQEQRSLRGGFGRSGDEAVPKLGKDGGANGLTSEVKVIPIEQEKVLAR